MDFLTTSFWLLLGLRQGLGLGLLLLWALLQGSIQILERLLQWFTAAMGAIAGLAGRI